MRKTIKVKAHVCTKWNRIKKTKIIKWKNRDAQNCQGHIEECLVCSHQFLSTSQLCWLSRIVTSIDCYNKRWQAATFSHMPSHSRNGFGDKRIIKKSQLLAFHVSFIGCETHWMVMWWSGTFQVSGGKKCFKGKYIIGNVPRVWQADCYHSHICYITTDRQVSIAQTQEMFPGFFTVLSDSCIYLMFTVQSRVTLVYSSNIKQGSKCSYYIPNFRSFLKIFSASHLCSFGCPIYWFFVN